MFKINANLAILDNFEKDALDYLEGEGFNCVKLHSDYDYDGNLRIWIYYDEESAIYMLSDILEIDVEDLDMCRPLIPPKDNINVLYLSRKHLYTLIAKMYNVCVDDIAHNNKYTYLIYDNLS